MKTLLATVLAGAFLMTSYVAKAEEAPAAEGGAPKDAKKAKKAKKADKAEGAKDEGKAEKKEEKAGGW